MRRAFWAEPPTMMSQPVSSATAPRLAPPRRNRRRAGSGSSLAASRASSLASTPGMPARAMLILSAAADHRPQAPRNHERHHDVNRQEGHDRRHGEEMHQPRIVIAAEQRSELAQLHRLPDG